MCEGYVKARKSVENLTIYATKHIYPIILSCDRDHAVQEVESH